MWQWLLLYLILFRAIYEDPTLEPTPLDLHSACAIGYYEFVQDAINKNEELSNHNKGTQNTCNLGIKPRIL